DVGELRGIDEPAHGAEGELELGASGRGRQTEGAGGDLDVLLADGVDDIAGGHVAGSDFVGIEPDAHAVIARAENLDVADAVEAREGVLDLEVGVVAEVKLVVASVRR